jgi:hypothetical protein
VLRAQTNVQGVLAVGDPPRAWMDAQPPTEEPAESLERPAAAGRHFGFIDFQANDHVS